MQRFLAISMDDKSSFDRSSSVPRLLAVFFRSCQATKSDTKGRFLTHSERTRDKVHQLQSSVQDVLSESVADLELKPKDSALAAVIKHGARLALDSGSDNLGNLAKFVDVAAKVAGVGSADATAAPAPFISIHMTLPDVPWGKGHDGSIIENSRHKPLQPSWEAPIIDAEVVSTDDAPEAEDFQRNGGEYIPGKKQE
jgi:hypothetical protein